MTRKPKAANDGLMIEQVPIGSLLPYVANARTHSDAQVVQIAASIKTFGFNSPVLIDAKGVLVAGHGRAAGAKLLGLSVVPAIRLGHLTEAQARAYRLADNQLALNAGWDLGMLKLELTDLKLADFDIGVIGFSDKQFAELFPDEAKAADDAADADAPEPPAVPTSRRGDIWLLGGHRLMCGDATAEADVTRLLAGKKPHLMVTDPPYGVNYDATWRGRAGHATLGKNRTGKVSSDHRADWREAWALFPGSIAYVWHGGLMGGTVADSLAACGFSLRSQIIWNKTVMAMGRGDYHWKHEPCWYAVKGTGTWAGDRTQTTIWDIASPLHIMSGSKESKTSHPTQKPVECMRRPMLNNSAKGDLVYDPFAGSFTSGIAAEMTGRRCLAMEIDPGYVDVGVIRWQSMSGQAATLEADGRSFVEVQAERISAAAA